MPRRLVAVLVFVCGGFMAIAGQPPTTRYVDDGTCPEPGSGTEIDPFCLIQDCIDAAMDGDECVVADGTYFENINFLGKAITVRSSDGAGVTIIDAAGMGQVSAVACTSGEGPGTVLNGFTLTGGTGTDPGPGQLSSSTYLVVGGCPAIARIPPHTNTNTATRRFGMVPPPRLPL